MSVQLTLEALAKYRGFADIKNIGAAIHAMTKLALNAMDEAGYSEDLKWVQLSHIFGASGIPQETADIISKAVKKMVDEGKIDPKNKLEFLKILSEKYLAGD